jgi:hypothetical protein
MSMNVSGVAMRVKILAVAMLCMLAAAGCSSTPAAKGPVLVSFSERQRSRIEPVVQGKTYTSIADKLRDLPNEAYAGQDIALSETIMNEGQPSKGVRLIFNGTAVTDGFVGAPKEATVKGVFTDKKHPDVEQSAEFAPAPGGGWMATLPELPYGAQIDVNIIAPAAKGGNGNIQLLVQPTDPKGTSSVVISHNYKILDERDPSDIPTD